VSYRTMRALVMGGLFFILVAFYAITFSFRAITDTDLNSQQTRAFVLHGDLDLARYKDLKGTEEQYVRVDGHLFSPYGAGISLVGAPVYLPLIHLGASEHFLQGAIGVLSVAAATVIFHRVLGSLFGATLAAAGTIAFAFGTTMWTVAAMAFFQQGPVVMFECLGLAGLFSPRPHGARLAGFGFAMGALLRPTAAIPLVFVGILYLFEGRRPVRDYFFGASLPIAALVVQNRWIWGTWLTGGYQQLRFGFGANMPKALFELLFGWWRGMLVYSPMLILGFVGPVLALRRLERAIDRRVVVIGASSIATILLYSRWTTWWNGLNQFGYRYLLEAVPFLIVVAIYAVARAPRLRPYAYGLGVVSILTMTWGAGPSRGGFDGLLFATKIVDTSIGQAWIIFLDHPLPGLWRLAGVVLVGALIIVASRRLWDEGYEPQVFAHG
jgi:hypothetical protein